MDQSVVILDDGVIAQSVKAFLLGLLTMAFVILLLSGNKAGTAISPQVDQCQDAAGYTEALDRSRNGIVPGCSSGSAQLPESYNRSACADVPEQRLSRRTKGSC